MQRNSAEVGKPLCGGAASPVVMGKDASHYWTGSNTTCFLPVFCKQRERGGHEMREQARSVMGPRDRAGGRLSPFSSLV